MSGGTGDANAMTSGWSSMTTGRSAMTSGDGTETRRGAGPAGDLDRLRARLGPSPTVPLPGSTMPGCHCQAGGEGNHGVAAAAAAAAVAAADIMRASESTSMDPEMSQASQLLTRLKHGSATSQANLHVLNTD